MRIVSVGFLIFFAACTEHNPDSCCSTANQCAQVGLSGIIGCAEGKTCDAAGTCVAAQCMSSADCSGDTPICEGQLCVAKCMADAECEGLSGRPLCADDGVCVACKTDSDCASDAPICDASSRSCRGCTADDECAGGICLEADGSCKADAEVFFVTSGGTDVGECSRGNPCATISFVLAKAQPQYKYIHILGGTYDVGASTLNIAAACYLDAAGTTIKGPAGQPVLHFGYGLGGGVMSGVTVQGSNTPTTTIAVTIDIGATLEIFGSSIIHGISVNNARLTVEHTTFTSPTTTVGAVACTNAGTVSLSDNELQGTFVDSAGCTLSMENNRVDIATSCFQITGGLATIQNNLFVATDQLQDCGSVFSVNPGSAVRFNTFANTSDLVGDGAPLHCDASATVTSNIFAWGSTAPTASGCTPTSSLFDNATTEPLGTGSLKGDVSTFFVNRAAKDFHLAATSPAIGKAEDNTGVSADFDGFVRPATHPDIGAFEHH